tara:strand:- start:20 stop:433 length:414 start_codon:yes stop_codon:yes gene_type:complete
VKLIRDEDELKQLSLSKDFELTEKDLSEWLKDDETGISNPNRKGDLAEYYAVTWLWDQGYEVFQNSGCTGPIDMIAMTKQGDVTLIDVKTLQPDHRAKTGNRVQFKAGRTGLQIKLGVQFLLFNPDNRSLRFAEHIK